MTQTVRYALCRDDFTIVEDDIVSTDAAVKFRKFKYEQPEFKAVVLHVCEIRTTVEMKRVRAL